MLLLLWNVNQDAEYHEETIEERLVPQKVKEPVDA